jgi:hypothetical protein
MAIDTLYMNRGTEELQIPNIFYILPLGDTFLSSLPFLRRSKLEAKPAGHKENVSEDASHSTQE